MPRLCAYFYFIGLFAFLIAIPMCWTHCNLESDNTPNAPMVVLDVVFQVFEGKVVPGRIKNKNKMLPKENDIIAF